MLSAQEDTTKIKESVRYFYINYSVNIIIVEQNQLKIFFFSQGDSGGPLVCDKKMAVGIVSFNNGKTCDYPDVPNVYTDISKFLPWIKDILSKKTC